ncbi:protein FAR1-RELATED SEQUENCE 5-like [Cornus florida]|uniref:protein FAR1-RELATED SEQUENCE 5-like n=1 Tax=Cornus florida TaxID=4283 RepID=UPI00289E3285|nr:protein FAR1-RELATED SEQUENCE 5-like [Cornus florida]XP_059644169.1 protein FAR1-RELATED SEQUENCE 5-like [Cornus florida]XP_059644170.1 protein FAR1-RELATED SEQUENCE 5-like [Cornus florida]XP_059644171.1 protein FAR1-RELATED SEQUENCE 5-like [Cornus florida]XP_059644172.1 protein FAR1-RELATED SEQUENCE 5-like [Cornus florida]
MEEEQAKEVVELVDSYVGLEEEGDACCVVEDVEASMDLDDEKREDSLNFEYSNHLGGGLMEPTLDMEFISEDDARNFYNSYAKQTGFSIRVNSYYRSKKDNSIISREFCCSKEGFRRDKRAKKIDSGNNTKRRCARPITREGCKALMTVRRRDNGKWYVAKLEKNHNHELVTPAMRHFLRSHRQEADSNKSLRNSFSPPGMDSSTSMNILTEDYDSFGKMVYTPQNHVNYIGRGRLSTFGIDAQSLLGFFKIMQASDPAFYYAIQVDEEDRLSSVFWVDTRSRIAYNCFSDVVAFDTTYQVNQYKMPFAPFTGVNHHKQSVLFGCALLADESESTFIWLFTTWLEAMSGLQPGLIITDYDAAISKAAQRVFSESSHCYCKCHIMSKMAKEMGHTYSALPKTFQMELDKCINKSETPEDFESAWDLLLDKYNLRGNEWLQSLYIDRKLWVPIYIRNTFFAGMYATQRSGSVNSLFDGYVNARTTLQDFAEQYQKALDDRYEKEAKAEFETFYTKPILKTPLPIEKQAAEVYTRKMFTIFQDEIFESLVLAVKLSRDNGETSTYEVARFDEGHKLYFVDFNLSVQRASCSCKKFQFEGILCRHVVAVFKATNIFMLPPYYILKRWTRSAKDEVMLDVLPCVEMQGNSQRGKNSLYNILYQEAIKCVEEGMASDHSFKVAISALREARIKILGAKKIPINNPKVETVASTSHQDENNTTGSQVDSSPILVTSLDPHTTQTRGSSTENNISYPGVFIKQS